MFNNKCVETRYRQLNITLCSQEENSIKFRSLRNMGFCWNQNCEIGKLMKFLKEAGLFENNEEY